MKARAQLQKLLKLRYQNQALTMLLISSLPILGALDAR
jgi:hypothetical protein